MEDTRRSPQRPSTIDEISRCCIHWLNLVNTTRPPSPTSAAGTAPAAAWAGSARATTTPSPSRSSRASSANCSTDALDLKGTYPTRAVPLALLLQPAPPPLSTRLPHTSRVRTTTDHVTYAVTHRMKPGVHSPGSTSVDILYPVGDHHSLQACALKDTDDYWIVFDSGTDDSLSLFSTSGRGVVKDESGSSRGRSRWSVPEVDPSSVRSGSPDRPIDLRAGASHDDGPLVPESGRQKVAVLV